VVRIDDLRSFGSLAIERLDLPRQVAIALIGSTATYMLLTVPDVVIPVSSKTAGHVLLNVNHLMTERLSHVLKARQNLCVKQHGNQFAVTATDALAVRALGLEVLQVVYNTNIVTCIRQLFAQRSFDSLLRCCDNLAKNFQVTLHVGIDLDGSENVFVYFDIGLVAAHLCLLVCVSLTTQSFYERSKKKSTTFSPDFSQDRYR